VPDSNAEKHPTPDAEPLRDLPARPDEHPDDVKGGRGIGITKLPPPAGPVPIPYPNT